MSDSFAQSEGAAGSFWSVELEVEDLILVRAWRGHSSSGWLSLSWLLIHGIWVFFGQGDLGGHSHPAGAGGIKGWDWEDK